MSKEKHIPGPHWVFAYVVESGVDALYWIYNSVFVSACQVELVPFFVSWTALDDSVIWPRGTVNVFGLVLWVRVEK